MELATDLAGQLSIIRDYLEERGHYGPDPLDFGKNDLLRNFLIDAQAIALTQNDFSLKAMLQQLGNLMPTVEFYYNRH